MALKYSASLLVLLCTTLMIFPGSRAFAIPDDPASGSPRVFADHSVLSSGNWYKMAITQSGIYKLDFSYLQGIGVQLQGVDPGSIRIFGNGGAMLPESNAVKRVDDLAENAIFVNGESDGSFDAGDFILFYADGPVQWKYNPAQKMWEHSVNCYSDTSYYFLSLGGSVKGKRVQTLAPAATEPSAEVSSYDFRAYWEKDGVNLIKSGRTWYGEAFDVFVSQDFSFDIPEILPGSDITVKTSTAARSTSGSYFTYSVGTTSWQAAHSPISTYYNSPYASGNTTYKKVPSTASPLVVKVTYNKPNSTSTAWLDYIDISARRSLNFNGGQMGFRDVVSAIVGNTVRFRVSGAKSDMMVWDITNPLLPGKISGSLSGTEFSFVQSADSLREYIAFDYSALLVPRVAMALPNQDLHALSDLDMVIVAPQVFSDQAYRLANFHATVDGLNCKVVSPVSIYNEFSSGKPDVIAIRDFMKMLYDRGKNKGVPRYLLLFGDGSYDNKNRLVSNSNFIPTWQTAESFDPVRSGVSDDYFGLLDDSDGASVTDQVDIGIGRLPVQTAEEAESMVNKIVHYSEKSSEVMGDWRNLISFIADDEDGNEHVIQADNMAGLIRDNYPDYNIDKIYMDAYPQAATTSGARYPDVTKAITQRVEKGCLFLNYTGHGGETGWAHEQVLEVQDINSWKNYRNMPVFVTATCEFSRFDDPGRVSAGELVLLNALGGGIALYTTTRPTYGSPNFELNKSLYEYALSHSDDPSVRMGDIMKEAKRKSGSNENGKKFILLGDPALRIAFPEYKVVTSTINGFESGAEPDTLKAYSEVTVSGSITDRSGNLVSDFNGMVYPTVFDKPVIQETLGNDQGTPFSFSLQKSILYKGKVQVQQGLFNFSFIVPKDIAYRYDFGRLSYYATDGTHDASGSYSNLVIGGSQEGLHADATGPEIRLFMNDEHFINGGITDENPWLYAVVFDESGINTIGTGIGHDLTAVLDGKTDQPYILNDFYESDINTYTSGKIRFPFSQLEAGEHSLEIKVWDIYNNSSEATLRFVVYHSESMVLQSPSAYPNPFSDHTNLVAEHNQQGRDLEVRADIYNFSGQLVKTIENHSISLGVRTDPVQWDGTTTDGNEAAPGIYLYSLSVKTPDGQESRISGKMIKSR